MTERQNMNWNEYIKDYKKRHPDKALRYRLVSAERLLQKHGYTVIAPNDADQNEITNERGE